MDQKEKKFMNKPKLKKMFLNEVETIKPTGWTPEAVLRFRHANSGVSWDPRSQKLFELAEII